MEKEAEENVKDRARAIEETRREPIRLSSGSKNFWDKKEEANEEEVGNTLKGRRGDMDGRFRDK